MNGIILFYILLQCCIYVLVGQGNPNEGNHLKDLDVDGRVLFKYIFKKWDGESWNGLFWLRTGTGGRRL